mmetsp:Transcript_50298/g.75133  ORF Transcript_50298/g.75133 Transcript_50298/m.75133 type:complete len:104 (+) Transcript_50298:77-388(+)
MSTEGNKRKASDHHGSERRSRRSVRKPKPTSNVDDDEVKASSEAPPQQQRIANDRFAPGAAIATSSSLLDILKSLLVMDLAKKTEGLRYPWTGLVRLLRRSPP